MSRTRQWLRRSAAPAIPALLLFLEGCQVTTRAPQQAPQEALIAAIEADSEAAITQAIAQGADVNRPMDSGATPLMWGAGLRAVERLLRVTETCHQQQRNVFSYLTAALAAHRTGAATPQLLSAH